MPDTDLSTQAKEYLFYLISRRPRSISEARKSLEKKYPDHSQMIETVIEELIQRAYLDDTAFVRWWIDQRDTFRPKGSMALEKELVQKGIARSVIRDVLSQQSDRVSEKDQALQIADSKLSRLRDDPYVKKKEKLTRFLLSRGYSWQVTRDVIDSVLKTSYNEQTLE